VLLFLLTPFVEDLPQGNLVDSALLTLVMVSAVLTLGGRRPALLVAGFVVVPALAARWGHHLRPDLVPAEFFLVPAVVFFAVAIVHLLRFILRAPVVNAEVLCAGISGYLMLGLLFMPAYLLVARVSPGAFSLGAGAGRPMQSFAAFYFSFITLSSVGYGDVTPVSKVARTLAVMEAIAGLFYVAVLISRLVAMHSSARPPDQGSPPG